MTHSRGEHCLRKSLKSKDKHWRISTTIKLGIKNTWWFALTSQHSVLSVWRHTLCIIPSIEIQQGDPSAGNRRTYSLPAKKSSSHHHIFCSLSLLELPSPSWFCLRVPALDRKWHGKSWRSSLLHKDRRTMPTGRYGDGWKSQNQG